MKNISTIARIILSLVLIYLVYTETGFFTALTVFLIMLNIELKNKLKKQLNK